jgi:signal transduction histidine kinase
MVRSAAAWLRHASGPWPRPPHRTLLIDALPALVLAAYALAAMHSEAGAANFYPVKLALLKPFGQFVSGPGPRDYLSVAVTTVPLAWRRRYPLAVFWIVIGTSVIQPGRGDAAEKLVACALAAYTAAAHSPYRRAASISLLGAAAAVAGTYEDALPDIPKWLGVLLVIVPIAAAGTTLRSLRERIADAHERELVLERDKAQAAQLATEQERARIARELHDVITHNVSVMVVQAGAARTVLSRSPEQATSALLVVEAAGRAAMTELQHTIGLLAPDAEEQLAPQPGLAELGELIGRVRATGMRVDLTETGTPRPLGPGSDLAAYRVVQEALTNAAKHAVGAAARVRIVYGAHELIVEVDNDAGDGPSSSATTTGITTGNGNGGGCGRGLIGLRERLAACGGQLRTGRSPRGGFQVRAAIPLQDQAHGAKVHAVDAHEAETHGVGEPAAETHAVEAE